MQHEANRKTGRRRETTSGQVLIFSEGSLEVSIRQAFLTHMDEQQRQFAAEKPATALAGSLSLGKSGQR